MNTHYAPYSKLLKDALGEIANHGALSTWDAFGQFLFVAASSLQQAVNRLCGKCDETLEARIVETQKRAKNPEAYSKAFAIVVNALEHQAGDFLGAFVSDIALTNKNIGQFFTPYNVSLMMAKMTLDDAIPNVEHPLRLNEPSCGAGGMIVAMFEVLKARGFGPRDFYVVAQDIDIRCVQMTYIQTTLLGIPCDVYHMDTLAMNVYARYPNLNFAINHPAVLPGGYESDYEPTTKKPTTEPRLEEAICAGSQQMELSL